MLTFQTHINSLNVCMAKKQMNMNIFQYVKNTNVPIDMPRPFYNKYMYSVLQRIKFNPWVAMGPHSDAPYSVILLCLTPANLNG